MYKEGHSLKCCLYAATQCTINILIHFVVILSWNVKMRISWYVILFPSEVYNNYWHITHRPSERSTGNTHEYRQVLRVPCAQHVRTDIDLTYAKRIEQKET